jgi:hypothetical protein
MSIYTTIKTVAKVSLAVVACVAISSPVAQIELETAKKCRQTSDAGCVNINNLGNLYQEELQAKKKCRQTSDAGCVNINDLGA